MAQRGGQCLPGTRDLHDCPPRSPDKCPAPDDIRRLPSAAVSHLRAPIALAVVLLVGYGVYATARIASLESQVAAYRTYAIQRDASLESATQRIASLESQLAFTVVSKDVRGVPGRPGLFEGCVKYRALGTTEEWCGLPTSTPPPGSAGDVTMPTCWTDAQLGAPLPQSCRDTPSSLLPSAPPGDGQSSSARGTAATIAPTTATGVATPAPTTASRAQYVDCLRSALGQNAAPYNGIVIGGVVYTPAPSTLSPNCRRLLEPSQSP